MPSTAWCTENTCTQLFGRRTGSEKVVILLLLHFIVHYKFFVVFGLYSSFLYSCVHNFYGASIGLSLFLASKIPTMANIYILIGICEPNQVNFMQLFIVNICLHYYKKNATNFVLSTKTQIFGITRIDSHQIQCFYFLLP